MFHAMERSFIPLLLLSAILTGCNRDTPLSPQLGVPGGPSYEISDGSHGAGNPHFFFLPPMVKRVKHQGAFDPSLSPVVEICQWEGACTRSVARFTTDGKGSERVRVKRRRELYRVIWHTRRSHLETGKVYRIAVSVNGTELGHADVKVEPRWRRLRKVDTGEFISLKNGRTLPINFRIEQGAVFAVGADGGSFTNADGSVKLDVPRGALSEDLGITVSRLADPKGDPALAAGTVHQFGPEGTRFREGVTLSIRYDALPEGFSEGRLRLYKRVGSSWLEVPGSHVDAVNHTVTGSITSFSTYAVLGSSQMEELWAHACAITAAGQSYCWGNNEFGQLGDGTTTPRTTPQPVTFAQLSAIAPGWGHTCGLTASGQAYCWGFNDVGELGNGTVSGYVNPTPVSVAQGGVVYRSISSGGYHTCAVSTDEKIYCWGFNANGQLGNGSTADATTPQLVSLPGVTFKDVTAGSFNSCAVATTGAGYCWGSNDNGRLGTGSTAPQATTPQLVPGDLNFMKIVAGFGGFVCGLTTSGELYCWGRNVEGGLGTGDRLDRNVPTAVGGSLRFVDVSVGYRHACAVSDAGRGYCWGQTATGPDMNQDVGFGQLGDGTLGDHLTPQPVSGGLTFRSINAALSTSCGITTLGFAYCWGDSTDGQLGNGAIWYNLAPVPVTGGHHFTAVATGQTFSCGIDASLGSAFCWGDGPAGELGNTSATRSAMPIPVTNAPAFVSVAGNFSRHTCGLTALGEAYCWGDNSFGQLGDNTTQNRTDPVRVQGGLLFNKIAPGSYNGGFFTCGVATDGRAYCWGDNSEGQLGTGDYTTHLTPAPINSPLTFLDVDGGEYYACGIASSHAAYCWGGNANGELGTGAVASSTSPAPVSGGHAFQAISAGGHHTCAITTDGDAYCWGRATDGQLGNGGSGDSPVPVLVSGGHNFVEVSVGIFHACARTTTGDVYCWGSNYQGRTGGGTRENALTPVFVGSGFVSVSAADQHSCGVKSSGQAYCWGAERYGKIGTGQYRFYTAPVPIAAGLTF